MVHHETNLQSTNIRPARKGLVTLPPELFLEIVGYFPEIDIQVILDCRQTLPVEFRERFATLRALSQTCKELRLVVLPLAWERLEACTTAGNQKAFYREVGERLERKCKGLMKSDHLRPHVRFVLYSTFIEMHVADFFYSALSPSRSPGTKQTRSFQFSPNALQCCRICIQTKYRTLTRK